jgi:hypothetical protein
LLVDGRHVARLNRDAKSIVITAERRHHPRCRWHGGVIGACPLNAPGAFLT